MPQPLSSCPPVAGPPTNQAHPEVRGHGSRGEAMQPQRSASWGTGQGKEVQGADEGTREGEENNKTCFDWLSICPPLKKNTLGGRAISSWLQTSALSTT